MPNHTNTFFPFVFIPFLQQFRSFVSQVVLKDSHFILRPVSPAYQNKIPKCRCTGPHTLFTVCTTHSHEHCCQGSSVRLHSGTTPHLITFPVTMETRITKRCYVIHPCHLDQSSAPLSLFRFTSVKHENTLVVK